MPTDPTRAAYTTRLRNEIATAAVERNAELERFHQVEDISPNEVRRLHNLGQDMRNQSELNSPNAPPKMRNLVSAAVNHGFNSVQSLHSVGSAVVNRMLNTSSKNYKHNSKIDIDERFGNNGFIDLQTSHAGDFRMGILDTSDRMGCVWMATYNALNALGDRHHPAEIIQWMERNGGFLLQGRQGAFTQPAERYMRQAGYNTRTNYLPQLRIIDNDIRRGDVAILTYMRGDFSGHAVAIQYVGDGRFRVYNEGTLWQNYGGYTNSIEKWIRSQLQREGRNTMSMVTSLTIINR